MKGFCFMFSIEAGWVGEMASTANKTKEFVFDLRSGMELLEKRPVSTTPGQTGYTSGGVETQSFMTTPESPKTQSSTTTLESPKTQSSKTISESSKTQSPTTTPESPTTLENAVKRVAGKVLNEETKGSLASSGWAGRDDLHKKIVKDTVSKLKDQTSYVVNPLALLPYDRDDQWCRHFAKEKFVDVGYWNLKFFVLHATNDSNLAADEAWNAMTNKEGEIMERVFGKSGRNLCELLPDEKSFGGGIAAVKCGYKFVWYQLGYAYFYAAHSSTPYQWEMKGGDYDAKCGQLYFFP